MAQKNRTQLKTIWSTGTTITESLFDDVWDSFQNILDDGVSPNIPQIKGTSINYLPFGNGALTAGANRLTN